MGSKFLINYLRQKWCDLQSLFVAPRLGCACAQPSCGLGLLRMNSSRAANRTCRLCVFKEVHLTSTSFLKAIFKAVYRQCVDVLLGKTVPSIYNPLRKEAQSTIVTTTISLRQFPAVSSGYSIFSLVKEA